MPKKKTTKKTTSQKQSNNRKGETTSIYLEDDVKAVIAERAKVLRASASWVINNGMRQSLGMINEIGG